MVAATEAFAGPSAGAAVHADNVATANAMGLNGIDTHEGSCKDHGYGSNAACSIGAVKVTTL
jgi:hypothetical protein